MTDELDILRATRATVDPPSAAARRAARARWDRAPLEMRTTAPVPRASGAKALTARIAIAGVLAIAMVTGVWFVTRERIKSVKPQHVLAVTSLAEVAATQPQVFLLVGSDSRSFIRDAASRSDTMVLVRINPTTRHVLVVSIPRDLFIELPGCGIRKINAAFNSDLVCDAAHGGMQLLVDTITRNLGVPINHVIEVQFPQFASLVDELGGLRIEFPVPARDRYTGLAETAGCATLTGDQALSFVRSRHLEWFDGVWHEDPRADLSRMERQQLALRQLAAAAQSRVGTDPRPLLRALFANITVDRGFMADDALRYFAALRGDHPTITMTLPTHLILRGDQQGLALAADAQSVLDALAGHGSIAAPHVGPSDPSGHNIEATSC